LLVGVGTSASATRPRGSSGRHATLDFVIDGDTVALTDGTHVRLIGINTPETKYSPNGAECFGAKASRFAKHLLPDGTDVRLVLDAEHHDRYGRLLAYVYRARDDLFVNAELVREGYAYVDTVPPNVEHASLFRKLARQAREHHRGLWAACPTQHGAARSLTGGCLPNYVGACVPPPPPDLDCKDIRHRVTVVGDDPHHLDGNHDGVACEEYG